jgi:hypothetical protein|tara:strand:+ start:8301 stop:8549 length:249 start_codon:yes stop_codon:yes gene_type:complete
MGESFFIILHYTVMLEYKRWRIDEHRRVVLEEGAPPPSGHSWAQGELEEQSEGGTEVVTSGFAGNVLPHEGRAADFTNNPNE